MFANVRDVPEVRDVRFGNVLEILKDVLEGSRSSISHTRYEVTPSTYS